MNTHNSGTETNPNAIISTGSLAHGGNSRACVWLRVGRLRFIWYRPKIQRVFLVRGLEGWQITVGQVAVSWTYKHGPKI
jgi:hypothetical protein